jgi:hypothetical protein
MVRLILYFAAAYILWIALGAVFRGIGRIAERKKRISGEDLVRCAACGTYVPKSDIVRRKGDDFCGKECAGKGRGRDSPESEDAPDTPSPPWTGSGGNPI